MTSYKTFLVPLIKEILIQEIGEANIKPLDWKPISPYRYEFSIPINNTPETVTVEFNPIADKDVRLNYFPAKYRYLSDVFNVSYTIKGVEKQFAKTDLKTLLIIISTIVDIIKYFIKTRRNLDGLFIMGSPKELSNNDITQKNNLYKAFIQKQLYQIPEFGFDTYKDGFILVNKNSRINPFPF
jgi:hypothetical protein